MVIQRKKERKNKKKKTSLSPLETGMFPLKVIYGSKMEKEKYKRKNTESPILQCLMVLDYNG